MRPRASSFRIVVSLGLGLVLAAACGESPSGLAPTPTPTPDPGPPAPPPSRSTPVVHLAGPDGSDPRPLVEGAWPAWSPDGRLLAFHRVPERRASVMDIVVDGEIYVVDVEGGEERLLARGIEPAWSPDGERVAFTSEEGIAVIDAGGGPVTTLVPHDAPIRDQFRRFKLGVGRPAWSPDGEWIAFEHLGWALEGGSRVFVMAADGSDPRPLIPLGDRDFHDEFTPSWSPDGSRIVLRRSHRGIETVAWPDGAPEPLWNDSGLRYGTRPVWSPDGTTIAFAYDASRGWDCDALPCTIAVPVTGGSAWILLPDGYDAAWSPDGSRLAFVRAGD